MAIDLKDTYSLLQAIQRIKPPATFLVDTFFPNVPTVSASKIISVEFQKKGRRLAPFVTRGARGVNEEVEGSTVQFYEPPMMAPKISITPEMVEARSFGENFFSSETPEQRTAQLQAEALKDLQNMVMNRKNKMASDILTTGKCIIEGYADDAGTKKVLDTIDYGWSQKVTPSKSWADASAPIFQTIMNMSLQVQEASGMVPDTIVLGKNVFQYMLSNNEMGKYLAIPSRDNLSLFGFKPTIQSPQVIFNGTFTAIGANMYTYAETFTADDGKVTPFVPENGVIIGVSGKGRQIHGAVTLVDENGFKTYAAPYVPYLIADKNSQTMDLAVYSRCLLAPESVDDWAYMDVVTA